MVRNERGALTLPMSLAVLIIGLSGIALWGLLRHWNGLAETQLRLDRCVGERAHELRDAMNAIESGNARIRALRASQLAADFSPGAAAAIQAALRAQVAVQDFSRARWEISRIRWLAGAGCGGAGDLRPPMPEMRWKRPPDDPFGPLPLVWAGDDPTEFRIRRLRPPRAAGARVFKRAGKEAPGGSWKTEWF